jgi:hypothetical protein
MRIVQGREIRARLRPGPVQRCSDSLGLSNGIAQIGSWCHSQKLLLGIFR